jgi:hypothetical protein
MAWRQYLNRNKGHDVWITVRRQTRLHSDNQRAYLHGVVVEMIAGEIGEGHDETWALLKEKFCSRRRIELLSGKFLEMPPTTRDYTVEQMTELIERIRVWAATFLGLSIPDPNQVEVVL